VKVLFHGPPLSGKTFFGQLIAKEYKIHYVQADQVVADAITNLEKIVNRPPKEDELGDDDNKEAAKEVLEEYKLALAKNNNAQPVEFIVKFLKEKLNSMPCRNQGFVLDGFPNNLEETVQIFQGAGEEDGKDEASSAADKGIIPEFIVHLECSDEFLKNRAMKQNAEVEGKYDEQGKGYADILYSCLDPPCNIQIAKYR
jgi:adenylate kinase